MIKSFSPKTKEALKYYVYVYSDPDTKEPFYVGKGKGNRAFQHLDDQSETDKANKIDNAKSEEEVKNLLLRFLCMVLIIKLHLKLKLQLLI